MNSKFLLFFCEQGFSGLSVSPEDISALQALATSPNSCDLSFECAVANPSLDDNGAEFAVSHLP